MELSDSTQPASFSRVRPLARADSTPLCDYSLTLVERHWRWLLAGILLVQLLGFNGQWRVERDSALYLSTGRSLAEGRGYTYRGQPNHLIFPGLPYTIDAVFRIVHDQRHVALPLLVLMLLMGWATLGLTYRLFYLYAGHSTAIIMTLGVGLTRLFYRYCFEILSDLPFLLGVMAFLAGYEAIVHRPLRGEGPAYRARWYDYALLASGLALAISMRIVVWVVLGAIVVSVVMRVIAGRAGRREIGVAVGGIVALGAFYVVFRAHGAHNGKLVDDYEGTLVSMLTHRNSLFHHLGENIRDLFPLGAMVKALFGCALWTPVNAIVGILVVAMGVGLLRRRAVWGALVVLTVVMLLLFKPLDRYFLPVIPLLVFAWWRLLVWVNYRLGGKRGDFAFAALFFIGLGTNIARIGEIVVEQRRLPFLAHYHEGRYESLDRVADWLNKTTQEHDWILVGPTHGRILTYKAHRNFFEPSAAESESLPLDHLYMLTGPSWEDSKEGHRKVGRSEQARQERDRLAEWLSVMSMQHGPIVSEEPAGPSDSEKWDLYRIVPKK